MANPQPLLRGSCACGSITYQASTITDDGPVTLTRCHCVECRKTSGSAFLPFIHTASSTLTFSRPATAYAHTDKAERGFCSVCGSCLYMKYHMEPETTGICCGTIDWWNGKSEGMPFGHRKFLERDIYLTEKAEWWDAGKVDGVSRFSKDSEAFGERLREWEGRMEKMKGVGR